MPLFTAVSYFGPTMKCIKMAKGDVCRTVMITSGLSSEKDMKCNCIQKLHLDPSYKTLHTSPSQSRTCYKDTGVPRETQRQECGEPASHE